MSEPSPPAGYREVFRSLPFPALLLDVDLRVVDATRAYEEAVGRSLTSMLGSFVFDVFPGGPSASDGMKTLEASLRRVLTTGRRDHLPLLEYALQGSPGAGFFDRRWWTVANLPVLDTEGRVAGVLNTVDDITGRIHERERSRQELVATADAERWATSRLTGLAETALELSAAETVEELLDAVISRGLVALGADGGAFAVVDTTGAQLHLTMSDSLGSQARRAYSVLPVDGPMPVSVATRTGEAVLLPDEAAGLALTPAMAEVHATTGKVAWAALPLRAGGEALGSLIASWNEPHEFSEDDVRMMDALAAQCAQALHRLLRRNAEREAGAETRRFSEDLQRTLLTEPPQPEHLQIAVRYLSAAAGIEVGGDWYDAFLIDGVTSLVVADVAGHDREAATAMAQMRGVLRGVAHASANGPAGILAGLDRAMADLGLDRLTTAVLAQIEQGRREAEQDLRLLRWSNAGHPPPLLLHPDGAAEFLERPADLLLGLDPRAERRDHTHLLPAGCTVLFYTDGLVERRDADLDRGNAWLAEAASALVGLPLEELCDALLGELEGKLQDDVALLALRPLIETRPGPAEAGPGMVLSETGRVPLPRTGASGAAGEKAGTAAETPDPAHGSETSVMLPCDPAAVRQGRAFVTAFCARQELSEEICETAVLLASEVVTNAILHGRSDVRLALSPATHGVRVEVKDANSRHPTQVASDGNALDGRGIAIVEMLARDWGVRDEPPGKVVWFEVVAVPA